VLEGLIGERHDFDRFVYSFNLIRYLLKLSGGNGVKRVGLYRPDSPCMTPPHSWDGISTDINVGRQGGYLYAVWKY